MSCLGLQSKTKVKKNFLHLRAVFTRVLKSNWFCMSTLYDWFKKPASLFNPIGSKTNRYSPTPVFPRCASALRVYFCWVLIGSLDFRRLLWLARVITTSVWVCCILQLEKLIEKNYYLHKSAREAYRSYLQAYASHQHKTIFNVNALDLQRVAPAFGFLVPPRVNLSILLISVLSLLTEFLMTRLILFGWI